MQKEGTCPANPRVGISQKFGDRSETGVTKMIDVRFVNVVTLLASCRFIPKATGELQSCVRGAHREGSKRALEIRICNATTRGA